MKLWKHAVLGYMGGMLYVLLELLWRGWSHGSMFVVGGICFVLIGGINTRYPDMPLFMQAVLGAVIVTGMEFISGLYLNVYLGLGVWDYSSLPYNLMGQICAAYFFLWILLSPLAALLEDFFRWRLFREKRRRYVLL